MYVDRKYGHLWTENSTKFCSCRLIQEESRAQNPSNGNVIDNGDKISILELTKGGHDFVIPKPLPYFSSYKDFHGYILDNFSFKKEAIVTALDLAENLSNVSHILTV